MIIVSEIFSNWACLFLEALTQPGFLKGQRFSKIYSYLKKEISYFFNIHKMVE